VNNFALDFFKNLGYITLNMNEEIDYLTKKLLDEICAGVEIPSDEETEEAVEMQQG
tara:strand:+ start:114 stop:281 length:168 start_codon:yes stop_codon:yes gene_type:complete